MKFLIYVCDENGLGHLFNALLQSAYYAYKTERTLAIDMRRFIYFRNNRHENFLSNFGWRFPDALHVMTDLKEVDRLISSPDVRMIVQGDRLDVDRPFDDDVIVVQAYTPGEPYTVDRRQVDVPIHLTLRGDLATSWQDAKNNNAWPGVAVGMHFRAMTGEFVERMNRYVIPDFNERLEVIRDAYIATALSLSGSAGLDNPCYYVASDDDTFTEFVRTKLGRVITNSATIPVRRDLSWVQHLEENNFDISILVDATTDLWFLSECDALIRSPYSGYSKFAILNSQKLVASRIVDMTVPTCAEIFAALESEVAVKWTRTALRKAQARRVRDAYPYQWFIDALERDGRDAEAKHIRKQADWQWDASNSPAANVPGEIWNPHDLRGDRLESAIAAGRRLAERLPGNPYVLAGYVPRCLAHLLAEAGRTEEAVLIAQRAVDMAPDDAYLSHHLAQLLMKAGRPDEAEPTFRRAVALSLYDGALFGDYARCLIRLDRAMDAVPMLRAAIALSPDQLQWRIDLAGLLQTQGAVDQAKAALMDGLPIDGRRADVLNALSLILENAGDPRGAIEAAKEACASEPHVLKWKYRLGELYIATDDNQRGVETFQQILAAIPESAHANHAISILWQRLGNLHEALNASLRALELEPHEPHRHARVGESLMLIGNSMSAREYLEKAITLLDESAETRFLHSIVMERLGDFAGSLESARRAVDIAPSDQRWQNRIADLSALRE